MFSEEEIIKECIKGNRKAEKHLYTKYNGLFFAICLRYTQSREEAEDVLITGFTSIFESLPMYKKQGSFEGWMRRIIVNTALEKYRSRNRLYMVEDIDMIPEPFVDPDNEDYSGLDAGDLMEIIRMLPPKYRMVFNLFALEGYSHREISRMINISEGTSKSNLARARMILQRRVEAYTGIKKKVLNG